METGNLLSAAKDVGKYILITFGVYFVAIVVHIMLGFISEKVLPALGLNVSGTAYTSITTIITTIGTAITAIIAIVTVITGLLTLSIVLKAFGVKLDFDFGSKRV